MRLGDLDALKEVISTCDKFACLPDTRLVPFYRLANAEKNYVPYVHFEDIVKAIDNAPTVTDGIIAAIYDKYMSCDGQIHNDTANEIIKLIKENASLKKENASLKKAIQDYD